MDTWKQTPSSEKLRNKTNDDKRNSDTLTNLHVCWKTSKFIWSFSLVLWLFFFCICSSFFLFFHLRVLSFLCPSFCPLVVLFIFLLFEKIPFILPTPPLLLPLPPLTPLFCEPSTPASPQELRFRAGAHTVPSTLTACGCPLLRSHPLKRT